MTFGRNIQNTLEYRVCMFHCILINLELYRFKVGAFFETQCTIESCGKIVQVELTANRYHKIIL